MKRIIVMAIALAAGVALANWAQPWLSAQIKMTPDNTNNFTRALIIIPAVGCMLFLVGCGWWAGKILDKKGDLE